MIIKGVFVSVCIKVLFGIVIDIVFVIFVRLFLVLGVSFVIVYINIWLSKSIINY